METPLYGPGRRKLHVLKIRGRDFRTGYHDFIIELGEPVFPRLAAAEHRGEPERGTVASGIPGLDLLLSSGAERGGSDERPVFQ
jgi:circadian clock protein KaiC